MPPRKRPWFRFYVEAVWDRKLRRLAPEHRWLWVVVLAMARQSPVSGYLLLSDGTPCTLEDVADAANLREKDTARGLNAFLDMGLIMSDPTFSAWFVAKWKERQYESDDVTKRTQKHRETTDGTTLERSNVEESNGDVTPPENRGTENRNNTYPAAFEEAWEAYPRKVNKKGTFKAWEARRRAGVGADVLLSAVQNYAEECARERREVRFIKQPATFFGPNDHWEDYRDGAPNLGAVKQPEKRDHGGRLVVE